MYVGDYTVDIKKALACLLMGGSRCVDSVYYHSIVTYVHVCMYVCMYVVPNALCIEVR
jgi:hypothetical protein